MTQTSFDFSAADTRAAAAAKIAPLKATQQRRILDYLHKVGQFGATCEELELALHMCGDSVRPRLDELKKDGLVVQTDRRRTNRKGNKMRVWVIID